MSKLKDFFGRSVSGLAAAVRLGPIGTNTQQLAVTGTCGKRGTHYRRYIGYERLGPFFRQIGLKADGSPEMEAHFIHHFLHATKGFRDRIVLPYDIGSAGKPARGVA